ncbi:MAG: hypothetical protein ABH842_03915 [Candidatus Micrarchaeota archaeon]
MRCTRESEGRKPESVSQRNPAIKFAAAAARGLVLTTGFGLTLVASPGQFINSGVPIPLAFT